MSTSSIKLESSWLKYLEEEFSKSYMQNLKAFLLREKEAGKTIFPRGEAIFAAFNATPFRAVKVVILGQDPYHGDGQAHGLCFSVQPEVRLPPSLVNIYKELMQDLQTPVPKGGCLQHWAEQGVLLLNSVLTVERDRAASHQGKGWEVFTDQVIEVLNREREHLVFILWGSYAQKKGSRIDTRKHLVLSAPHPSPLSAHRGFLGSKPFSKTNHYLISRGVEPIQWS